MPAAVKWTGEVPAPVAQVEVLGNGKAIEELCRLGGGLGEGEPITRAAILYGPAGTGKTSAALALARERDWDYIEMNASDARTAGLIERIAGPPLRAAHFREGGVW